MLLDDIVVSMLDESRMSLNGDREREREKERKKERKKAVSS